MRKLKILVDMDSIACDTLPYWLDRIAQNTGVRAKVDDIKLWAMDKCPPLDKVDPRLIFGVLQEPGFIHGIPPMPGVAKVLKQLMDDGHQVMLCTARHGPVSMPETITWMRQHLPFMSPEKQTAFIYDKEWVEADVIIDDKAETLVKYLNKHQKAIALTITYPYNADLAHDRLGRVDYGPDAWDRLGFVVNVAANVEES